MLLEEFSQGFGLLDDSWNFPESLFYQGTSYPDDFSELDAAVLRLLYSDQFYPGMTEEEVDRALDQEEQLVSRL